MNKLGQTAILAASVALIAQSGHASPNNDLILGLSKTTGTVDYTIDLGNFATGVGVGGATVKDLGGFISGSTFNTAFGGVGGVTAGVAGGSSLSSGFTFVTVTRDSLGIPGVAGSSAPQTGSGNFTPTDAKAIGLHALGVAIGTPANTDAASWTQNEINYLASQDAFSPQTALANGAIYEDLWSTKNSSVSWSYQGFFTLDFSGANPSLSFTPVGVAPVPEPTAGALLGGAGLLTFLFRRRLGNAAV